MDVEVCYAESLTATRIAVAVAAGATVADAVARSGIVALLSLGGTDLAYSVFGRRATADTVLGPGDRIELLRPLVVDPQTARFRRVAKKRAEQDAVARAARDDATPRGR